MRAGADYLLDHLPSNGSVRDPQRDTYYWYYATQVMFHMGGDYWKKWNGALHPLLIYYSQEARMYALLTALGVLIGLVATVWDGNAWLGLVVGVTLALNTMIDIAENDYKLEIRKKSGPKQ